MLVGRADPQTARLEVSYDDHCEAVATHLLYGPLDQLAGYSLSGSICDVANPIAWDGVPEDDVWFLLVGGNGAGAESSWGHSSHGERNGSAASGHSEAINGLSAAWRATGRPTFSAVSKFSLKMPHEPP